MSTAADTRDYSKRDFMSDQTVRWCPGCGDYAILSQVQSTFASLGIPKEQFAVISGIGCSGRFPYYVDTYGFHTIHGRAPAFATGLKASRPDLDVWVVTGDGDGLSIGGNHLIHVLRRNVDVNILLFNNQIYGLTKGQYSPTSEVGKRTKSTPMGSIDEPFKPLQLALGAGASYVARSVDRMPRHLKASLQAAHDHEGTVFLEIYQNCNIFNDGAFEDFTDRSVRDDRILFLEHGEPLIWGEQGDKGIVLEGMAPREVTLGDEYDEGDVLVHDETNVLQAQMLARMEWPEWPVPLGVLYREDRPTYDGAFREQIEQARETLGTGDLEELLTAGDTWRVE